MELSVSFWKQQRVLVTGGAGFLGSHLVDRLKLLSPCSMIIPRSRQHDLRDANVIQTMMETEKPTMVIHLAAKCGGIGANQESPGSFFYDNAIMGIQLMEYARRSAVSKFVQVGTVCAYPKFTPVPFNEDDLWNGYPEETNAPYGLAKKMLLVQAQAYRQQYGFNAIYLLPANLYGPRDNFDLHTSHVIPALIRKFMDAKLRGDSAVTLWGTGVASRDFYYVEDAANSILLAAEHYNDSNPLNLGTGIEIQISQLAHTIKQLVGFKGEILWDSTKPDGQPKRQLAIERFNSVLGPQSQTTLIDGLKKTIAFYSMKK